MSTEKKENGSQVLLRTLKLFDILANSIGKTAISLSKDMNISRQTVHSMLVPLQKFGYVEKDELTGNYRLGYKFYELGRGYREYYHFSPVAEQHAKALSKATGLQSNIGVLKAHDKVVMIISVDLFDENRAPSVVTIPAHCSSCGKAMLASLDEEALEDVLNYIDFSPYTRSSITDEARLREELDNVRKNGYATELGEFFNSKGCIGAPIYDWNGHVVAAISVYANIEYIKENKDHLITEVLTAADEASRELGWQK